MYRKIKCQRSNSNSGFISTFYQLNDIYQKPMYPSTVFRSLWLPVALELKRVIRKRNLKETNKVCELSYIEKQRARGMWRLSLPVYLLAWLPCDNTTVVNFSTQLQQRRRERLTQYHYKLPGFILSPEEWKRSLISQLVHYIARLMFPIPNVRTDVVEVSHVLTEEPVTRLVTSRARDSRVHAVHTSREDFVKPVSWAKSFHYRLACV